MKTFHIVYGLWVNVDFSEVASGRIPPPYVDYTKVNYLDLQQMLAKTFPYGPPVTLRVADDVIDIATASERDGGSSEKMHCADFGDLLLKAATKSKSPVIPVRTTWQHLHAYRDRSEVPPPAILPIVIEADFEDAVLWSQTVRACLGLKPFEALEQMAMSRAAAHIGHEGNIPSSLQQGLKDIFGCAFTTFGMLDRMATDPMPR